MASLVELALLLSGEAVFFPFWGICVFKSRVTHSKHTFGQRKAWLRVKGRPPRKDSLEEERTVGARNKARLSARAEHLGDLSW